MSPTTSSHAFPIDYTADRYNHVVVYIVTPQDLASLGEQTVPWNTRKAGTKTFTLRNSSAAALSGRSVTREEKCTPGRSPPSDPAILLRTSAARG